MRNMLKKYILKPWVLLIVGLSCISATVYTNDRLFEIAKNLELFANVFREVNTNYVDEVDPGTLMKIGIDAMLNSLDPYTNYISESQVQSYRISDDDRFQGIGTSFMPIDGKIFIAAPLSGGPAHEAGLRAGDELLNVNGVAVKGKTVEEINAIVRGAPGTEVNVTVQKHTTDAKIEELRIKRDEVNISNVPYSGFVDNGYGYINLTTFTENSSVNIAKALKKLKDEDEQMKGLVIDLRHNGGGLLREAIAICSLFLPKGEEIVNTKGKQKEKDYAYKTMGTPEDLDMPIVVLVDDKSASASEIVAGVLQDMDRAVIMGQRSYGKGLVQNFYEVGYNSRVKVTISKYYIPSGRCIQGVEYANGEPMNIPDSKRSKFKTRNGRIVLDGGGITPDVKLPKATLSPVTLALLQKGLIFEYCNNFIKKQKDSLDLDKFAFTEFDDFINFVKKNNFKYTIDGEAQLDSLMSVTASNDALAGNIKSEMNNIKNKIESYKQQEMLSHKQEIIHELEKEIASRYGFQKGRTKMNLKRDEEVVSAINLLKNNGEYKSLLKQK